MYRQMYLPPVDASTDRCDSRLIDWFIDVTTFFVRRIIRLVSAVDVSTDSCGTDRLTYRPADASTDEPTGADLQQSKCRTIDVLTDTHINQ